jgi:hypothetical protein
MIISRDRKKNNISEYVLYMWQIEDLIRAFKFDIESLEKNIFGTFSEDPLLRKEFYEWYSNLIQMMEMEQIKVNGHLQITKNIVLDLNTLHVELLKSPEENKYRELYALAVPNLYQFQQKISNPETNEVEMIFLGLYGLLLMRMKKVLINEETEKAMKTFSELLAFLTFKYHEREEQERSQLME